MSEPDFHANVPTSDHNAALQQFDLIHRINELRQRLPLSCDVLLQ
jgi:hypothetical protein